MINEIKKIGLFIKRDLRMLITYRIAFTSNFINMIFTFFYLVLYGSMFKDPNLTDISMYGGNYISYILIGSMGWSFLWNIMNSVSFSLRSEMMMGTLESILLTPSKIVTMMIAYTIFGGIFGLISMGILFFLGIAIFGVTAFATFNIFTLLFFILSIIMMGGFGMLFGGLTIWFKNIGQTIPIIQGVTMFFCGVYFPLTILPSKIQIFAKFIPFYYSIEGMRRSLIPGAIDSSLYSYIVILLICSIFAVIIGLFVLHKGLIKAKKEGSLGFY